MHFSLCKMCAYVADKKRLEQLRGLESLVRRKMDQGFASPLRGGEVVKG